MHRLIIYTYKNTRKIGTCEASEEKFKIIHMPK